LIEIVSPDGDPSAEAVGLRQDPGDGIVLFGRHDLVQPVTELLTSAGRSPDPPGFKTVHDTFASYGSSVAWSIVNGTLYIVAVSVEELSIGIAVQATLLARDDVVVLDNIFRLEVQSTPRAAALLSPQKSCDLWGDFWMPTEARAPV